MTKLVRDNIPAIIAKSGLTPDIRILDDAEYREALFAKLIEEAGELRDEPNIEEVADIYEVLESVKKVMNLSNDEIEKVRLAKKLKNGGFEKKILLINNIK